MQHGLDGMLEFWQVVIHGGLPDGVGCVEVAVSQVITHPGNLAPWDRGWLSRSSAGLDSLAGFQQPDPDGVEDQPVGESASLHVRANRVDGGLDVG
jgi:hypothetical protein